MSRDGDDGIYEWVKYDQPRTSGGCDKDSILITAVYACLQDDRFIELRNIRFDLLPSGALVHIEHLRDIVRARISAAIHNANRASVAKR